MRPTASLCARLRFSTKDVAKGFYRGNRTGSAGAHTPYGGYLIDWRKVRNYNVPDLKEFKLTPYVTKEIGEIESPGEQFDWEEGDQPDVASALSAKDLSVGRRTRAMAYLNEWRQLNYGQFEEYVNWQEKDVQALVKQEEEGQRVELFERYREAMRLKRRLSIAQHNPTTD